MYKNISKFSGNMENNWLVEQFFFSFLEGGSAGV
jgi:hypothetical protein